MHRPSRRHSAASAVLALSLLAPVTACGSEPVSPLPVEARSASTTPPASPSISSPSPSVSLTTRAPTRRAKPRSPTAPPPPVVTRSAACAGAVVYTLNADTELSFVKSICLAVGGILRVEGTGPGMVSADPQEKVAQFYEGGVEECRFLSPGSVTVTIVRDSQTYPISVVVV